jgi:hypothetical protein
MPASAHTALVVSIVASALGALVMCLLVARYGLTTDSAEDAGRGLLFTRFGHAFAGVCFAATGILGLVALVAPTREPRPAPATVVKIEPDRAAEARLQSLAAEVKAITTRIEQAEARMTVMDGASRRLGDEVGSMSARARQLERTIAALPRRTVVEPPAKETKPAPAAAPAVKETPRAPERPAAPQAAEAPGVTSPPPALPHLPEPAAAPRPQAPEPVVTPRPRGPEPVAHRPAPTAARAHDPAPGRAPEPVATPRVAPQSGRATIETPPRSGEGGAAMAKPGDPQLADKIREDWKTIRGGLSTAGDDFKSAVRDLGRKLWR